MSVARGLRAGPGLTLLILAIGCGGPSPAAARADAEAAAPAAPAPVPARDPAPGPSSPVPSPQWLGSDGRLAAEEGASPAAALVWADLLAAEGNFAAASRAYENLVRRWPGAPEAPGAMLSAARAALAAGDCDRAEGLANEVRNRWRTPERALDQDRLVVELGEERLAGATSGRLSAGEASRQVRRALAAFGIILDQDKDKVGPWAERAAFGRARAWLVLGKTSKGLEALEQFLTDYPRSNLVPEARNTIAAVNSAKARGRPPERSVLVGARESAEWAREQAGVPGGARPGSLDAIAETYRSIAVRQAELKIEEARLYLRLRQRRAAETVLRSVIGRYGDTPAADAAAKLLEELAGK